MAELNAKFSLEQKQIRANFSLEQTTIPAVFKINAAGTTWGSISGNIQNQRDLYSILQDKASVESVETLAETVQNNYDTLDGKIDDTESALEGQITALTNTVNINNQNVNNRVDTVEETVSNLTNTVSDNYTELNNKILDNSNDIADINSTISTYGNIVTHNVNEFATAAQGALADSALQSGDNISELNNNVGYITSASLPTVNNASLTIQRNGSEVVVFTANDSINKTANIVVPTQSSDIGALPDTTTIADLTTQAQLDAINSGITSGDVSLIQTALQPNDNVSELVNDAGYITSASLPTVNNGTLDIQVNGTSIGTFTANQANNTTANIVVPDSAVWGNITGTLSNQTDLQDALNDKQDVITDLETIRTNAQTGANLAPQVEVNTQRIEDLTVSKFPNAIIIGTPKIEGGQVSGFSDADYMQFPFIDISRGLPFDIYFSFTTTDDIATQQNLLDSHFGIALAIQNGKGVIALSSNGSSWDIGTSTGTNTLLPNTTYYVKFSWTGTEYNASLSLNETQYIPDMVLASDKSPYKTTIFIGGSPNLFGPGSAHPFKGTINFNKSRVVVNGIIVWEGMADVGLASRANVSLNNLDEVGEARFDAKQDVLVSASNIKTINGQSILGSGDLDIDALPSQTGQSGKFLTTDGTNASWATVTIPNPTYDSMNERITW